MRDQPWLQDHPLLQREGFERLCAPLKFFGDGLTVLGLAKAWGKSVECLVLSSLLSSGRPLETNALLAMVFKGRRTPRTMKKVWTVLKWSLQSLYHGHHPHTDWTGTAWPGGSLQAELAGKALAGGHFACVLARAPVASHMKDRETTRYDIWHT